MNLTDDFLMTIQPPMLRQRVQEIKKLWKQDFRKNSAKIVALTTEVLPTLKKNEEWSVYFELLVDFFYLLNYNSDYKKIIKYAEMFYQDMALYLDQAVRLCPGSDLAANGIYILSQIHEVYAEMYQIDDRKMEEFHEIYEGATDKYGKVSDYWEDILDLSLIYADPVMADLAAAKRLQYPKNHGCYVCNQRNFLGYYLLTDRIEEAGALIDKLVAKDIPKDQLWCYDRCQRADIISLYEELLMYAVNVGRTAAFKRYLPDFLAASEGNHDDQERYTAYAFFRAVIDDFSMLGFDLESLKEDIEEESMDKAYENICFFLMWYVYFTKLSNKGITTVLLEVKKAGFPQANVDGETEVGLVMDFFLAQADDLGEKFARSRAKFDYTSLKESYLSCGGLI